MSIDLTRPRVILAAHGAGVGSSANQCVLKLAAALAVSRRDLHVAAAFHLGSPTLSDLLAETSDPVTVLPIMTSDGYFAREYLRKQISRANVQLLPPIGVHPRAVRFCVDRLAEAVQANGAPADQVHILIVGHGTRRSVTSAEATNAIAAATCEVFPEADVQSAFLDQDPLLESVAPALSRPSTIVFPFLIGGGDHAIRDIPERMKAAAQTRMTLLAPFGDDPHLAELISEIVDTSVPRTVLRLGTRSSRLAQWQASSAAAALRAIGIETSQVVIQTEGDADKHAPLSAFATDGPFTDAIERALLAGTIDIAVHSLKDLPLVPTPGTHIAAVLPRADARETLVSNGNLALADLPRYATVGTCSERRGLQIKRLRPDLVPVPIRGTVEERIAQVRRGEVDATILALAGLTRLGRAHEAAEILPLDQFLPEAGQGAIAVQVRSDDRAARRAVESINHAESALAVVEERRFASRVEALGYVSAATWVSGREVGDKALRNGHLIGRIMSRDGQEWQEVSGASAEEAIMQRGSVSLVGAGPGDPGLITVRGLDLLRNAEVVVFDRLANSELLNQAPANAETIDAGKRPGQHTLTQDEINRVIVDRARAGYRVVRLKGGDPFVYGRGWEELEACRAAGIPCEVVPGVTSAIAAPAAAGVPVTARGIARTFAVVTPQVESGRNTAAAALDYEALARIDTVSVLMGRGVLREVVSGFLSAGRSATTPVAMIQDGTLPTQRVVRGDLASIADRADEAGVQAPAVIVIGDTAGLSQGSPRNDPETHGALGHSTPASRSLLQGKRVLVTRPRTASVDLIAALRAQGARVIDCPLIRIAYIMPPNAAAISQRYDWVVFTSLHAVRGLWRVLETRGLDARALAGARVAAVGPKTAAELRAIGVRADLVPAIHRASALIDALAGHDSHGQRVLFPCGTLARDELRAGLRQRGMTVEELAVYDTLPEATGVHAQREIEQGVDAALFYCPSAVRSAVDAGLCLESSVVACIGPTTAAAVREVGWDPQVVADTHTDTGLLSALRDYYENAAHALEVTA